MNATRRFAAWCGRRNIDELSSVQPFHVGGFIKDLQAEVSPPTVKQHVAALRMLFDWLVTGHVIDVNPAHAVRAPKYVVKKGKTPVLAANGSACMRRAARSMTFPAITISIIFRDNSCRYKRSGPCLVPSNQFTVLLERLTMIHPLLQFIVITERPDQYPLAAAAGVASARK
jgi:hypothetical protein